MDKVALIGFWRDWTKRQGKNSEVGGRRSEVGEDMAQNSDVFFLNPDSEVVQDVATGVLENEEKKGFKYCPCRLPVGDEKKDIGLVCPCNFKIQDTWKEKGECWCSLFVKDGEKEASIS